MNKTLYLKIGMALCIIILLGACDKKERIKPDLEQENEVIVDKNMNNQENEIKESKVKNMKVDKIAKNFILHAYSDFSDGSIQENEFVKEDSKPLIDFMRDRKEILNQHKELTGREIEPIDYKITDIQSNTLTNGLKEVLLTINHRYLAGGSESMMTVHYKIIIDEMKDNSIVAAMSNDISASKLLDVLARGYNELNLEYQLHPDELEKPYDLESRKQQLKELQKEFQ